MLSSMLSASDADDGVGRLIRASAERHTPTSGPAPLAACYKRPLLANIQCTSTGPSRAHKRARAPYFTKNTTQNAFATAVSAGKRSSKGVVSVNLLITVIEPASVLAGPKHKQECSAIKAYGKVPNENIRLVARILWRLDKDGTVVSDMQLTTLGRVGGPHH
ncbi:Histone-lysine N-methyltransferase SMYD1 [Oryzias melastigma]|uniref:Histone-lysine N-methyltransferase SMYD1 n=1 Tax=Oryzias melastigma TaxID=30732 RepID=A0A834CN53_ORYME|nr:Histone-lysine N-methyltransferase SMYD1 [Oryzias melastigma]